jgi:hypothetical protein
MAPYKTVSVDVDIDLGDFSTEELLEELEARGESPDHDLDAVIIAWRRGAKKDALILLERFFPELYDISKLNV